jgi:hypothetical protein
MKIIQLTQGKVALVDDDIFAYLNQFKWCAQRNSHIYWAHRQIYLGKGRKKTITMQSVIIGQPLKGFVIDHIDGNGLNNQRYNLRILSFRGNSQNRMRHRKGRLVGAHLKNDVFRAKPWAAEILLDGKRKRLGHFSTELEAHQAYLAAISPPLYECA